MRYPEWLRKQLPKQRQHQEIRKILGNDSIHTVCESALCPNRGECFSKKTVTYMILGNFCTRTCRFCAVHKGQPEVLNPEEPRLIAASAQQLGLQHIVITSVTRDDLPDGGAAQFAETIRAVRKVMPQSTIEVLTPDFKGDTGPIDTVLAAKPDVFNHNVETIARLYSMIRPQAGFQQSLDVLRHVRKKSSAIVKSGIMVGLGETDEEIRVVLQTLRDTGVQLVTIGQYLAPTKRHAPVERFVTPQQFAEYKTYGEALGIQNVFSGPFVRSSYLAAEALVTIRKNLQ
jgi:lipoic acid synthetase